MPQKKVIVLGLDGLEPKIIASLSKAKKIPHLAQLLYYSKLKTTVPPQSPVAWASFITGVKPTKHRLFDFVQRQAKNYQPYLPYSGQNKQLGFQAKPFWQVTEKIPTKILFLPDTYPAQKFKGQMITGMGTPDLMGTEGTFQLFSNRRIKKKIKRGQLIAISKGRRIKTFLHGPKYQTLLGIKTSQIPLTIIPKRKTVEIRIQNQNLSLNAGQFSPWVKLKFRVGFFKTVRGIVKFYLKSVRPSLNLYCSPINIDPEKPFYPIAYPKKYSSVLARNHGLFSTLGMPHDTWALNEGIFSQKAFLKQANDLLEERKAIILGELASFDQGLFVAYLGTTDSIQHMFWGRKKIIERYYQKLDQVVGQLFKYLNQKDSLFILSDHGFGLFNWEFHLNTWLKENGYLSLKKGRIGQELFENIDWGKTRAYALGFNSLYLNLEGREGQGIVSPREKTALIKKISRQLKALKNPSNGQKVIKNVSFGEEPDLIIGYYRGYRASWETAVGATPEKVFKKRTEKWRGDHLFDASEVPGVFFSNKKLDLKDPAITDIMPLALKEFGINFPHQ